MSHSWNHGACYVRLFSLRNMHLRFLNVFSFSLSLFFFFFFFFWAAHMTYEGSQARGLIGAVAASLHHSHSNTGSKLHLQPTLQLTAMPDPWPTDEVRDQIHILMDTSWICFSCATMGTPYIIFIFSYVVTLFISVDLSCVLSFQLDGLPLVFLVV